MTTTTILTTLTGLNACDEAKAWVLTLNDDVSNEAAWDACVRGDWIVWLLGALHRRDAITRQTLVLAACAAARTALVHVRAGETRPLAAIEIAEQWCRREATIEEVRDARHRAWAAYAADADAYDAYAAYAAYAAADAAAYADADAAAAAAYAAAAADAARVKHRAEIAVVVRGSIPWQTIADAIARLA